MKRSMMQVYIKNSGEAVSFYQNVFDAKVLIDARHENGTVAHAELDIFGQVFAICETLEPEIATGNAMQFCLHFGDGNEGLVREIIEKLSDGNTRMTMPNTAITLRARGWKFAKHGRRKVSNHGRTFQDAF